MDDETPPHTRATPDPQAPVGVNVDAAGARRSVIRRTFLSMALDTAPFRASRDFRLLFVGQGISTAGTMITYVAIPFQAYALTRSSLVVGLISFSELIAILLMALVGGALADAVDRRRMVRLSELGLCLSVGVLAVNASLRHPQLWVLFVVVIVAAALDAIRRPSLDAIVPRIVPPETLVAAAALDSLQGNLGMVLGPPVAGVLIATVGLPLTYGVDVATFIVSAVALTLMQAVPPAPDAAGVNLRAAMAGLRYATSRQDLLGSYAVDINAMFFGMPMALFPQIASGLGGPAVLGLLYTAPSAGSLLATLTSGWTRRVRHHGRAIAFAAASWGASIIAFGFAPSLWMALAGARGRRGGRHDQRALPLRPVEPDDPRRDARTPCRHRDGQLLVRSRAWQSRVRPRGFTRGRARLCGEWRHPLRRRDGRAQRAPAEVLELRSARKGLGRAGPDSVGERPDQREVAFRAMAIATTLAMTPAMSA